MSKKQKQSKKAKKSSKRSEVAAKPEAEIDTDSMSASTEVPQAGPAASETEVAVEYEQAEAAPAQAVGSGTAPKATRSEAAKANIKEGLRLHCSWTSKARPSVERCDAGLSESVLAPFWNGLSERTLEAHKLGPIDLQILGLNSFSFHSTDPVNGFCSTDEHLFRVASPQSAGTSKWPRIHDCNLPSCFATARCHRRGG
jgi:hypothetical protein